MHKTNHIPPSKHARERFQLKWTIITISSEEQYIPVAKRAIESCRRDPERFIRRDPFFASTPYKYHCPENAPEIAVRMADASSALGIGPMSAVAGTITAIAVEAMLDAGATYAIPDNDGDIALVNDETVIVGRGRGCERYKGGDLRSA